MAIRVFGSKDSEPLKRRQGHGRANPGPDAQHEWAAMRSEGKPDSNSQAAQARSKNTFEIFVVSTSKITSFSGYQSWSCFCGCASSTLPKALGSIVPWTLVASIGQNGPEVGSSTHQLLIMLAGSGMLTPLRISAETVAVVQRACAV